MKTSTKNKIITGVVTLICSTISAFCAKYISGQQQAQSIIVNVNGQDVSYVAQDVENLNDKSSELKKENETLKTTNNDLNTSISLLQDQIANLSDENEKLLDEMEGLKSENEHLTSTIIEYQTLIDNTSDELLPSVNNEDDYRSFLSECTPYFTTNYVSIIDNNIKMCGVTYSNGMEFACDGYYALFNLDGKYDKIKFEVGHVDGTVMAYGEIHIYVDKLDSNPVKIIPVDPEGMVESYEIELNGAKQMKIATVADKGSIGVGIVNIEVK